MSPSVDVFNMATTTHNDPLMLDPHHHDINGNGVSSHSDNRGGYVNPASSSSSTPALSSQDTHSDDDNGDEVTRPGEHDVLLGRGGGTNNHSGNIKFRKLVNEHKMRYLACSKVDKPKVAREVVAIWRKLTPPGRFLARKDDTKRGPGSVKASDNVWVEVGDKKAREKASQCLRERTPEVMPYIKHLREQQDAITEHGVSMVQQHMQLQQEGGSPRHAHMSPQAVHQGFAQQQHYSPATNRSPMVAQQAFPGRRTSMPVPPDPGMMGQMSPVQHQSMGMYQSPNARRSSGFNNGFNGNQHATGLPMAPVQDFMGGGDNHGDMYGNSGDYQQNMMMMQQQQQQQQQMQQQAQMRQMQQQQQQQQRLQQQQQQHLSMPSHQHSGYPQQQHQATYGNNDDAEPFPVQSDPLMNMPSSSPKQDKRSSAIPSRAREAPAERNVPDRAISLMSLTPDEEGGEITIESYRKQLEEYLDNIENKDNKDPTAPVAAFGDAEYASDLEDDWEKEREKNLQQPHSSKRGVDRNVSGFSLMSAKTTKSNLSMISGISASMFSDISDGVTPREGKMNTSRSVCSNISLMSELTDLSENLDNLGLDDE